MPIGKNSLKRVTNNGYSKVQTSSPDMENSEISLVGEAAEHTQKILTPKTDEGKSAIARAKERASEVAAKSKKPTDTKGSEAPKKQSRTAKAKAAVSTMKAESKSSVAKKPTATKKSSVKKTEPKKEVTTDTALREGEGYTNLGGKLPYYLL